MEPSAFQSHFIVVLDVFMSTASPSLQCPTPSSLSDTSHSVVTDDPQEARVAALCHVQCINYLCNTTTTCSLNDATDNNVTNNTREPVSYTL